MCFIGRSGDEAACGWSGWHVPCRGFPEPDIAWLRGRLVNGL